MNYFGLKRFYILLSLLILPLLSGKAQNKTFIICETDIPYQPQTWFYSGLGNKLDEANIKEYWDKGFRITFAAYTSNGWFITMAKNTGLTEQTYKLSSSWPDEWFEAKWREGYKITSMGRSDSQWLFVMSKGSGITKQSVWIAEWSKLSAWIAEKKKEYYFITAMAYNGKNWAIVLSKNSEYSTQGYFFTDTQNELESKIKENVWDRGYNLHKIGYGNGKYFVVYGNYKVKDNRGQNYKVNPDDVKQFISARWKDNLYIAYIGGGYSNNQSTVRHTDNTANSRYNLQGRNLNNNIKEYSQNERFYFSDCPGCNAGICNMCGGTGFMQFAGEFEFCVVCKGTGACPSCVGQGKILVDKYRMRSNMNESYNTPTTTMKTCSRCNGTGLIPRYEVESIARRSPNAQLRVCNQCGDSHYSTAHDNCHWCRGTGKIK